MKKILLVIALMLNLMSLKANAQCGETHTLCAKQFSKEDKEQGWNTNQQSESVSVEKGRVYETTVMAYKDMEYRLSVCLASDGGIPAYFQLAQDIMLTVEDSTGNAGIQKQRKIIFDNTADHTELYVIFRSNKTEKFYISVTVPTVENDKNKKLENPDQICLGILLEHRRVGKSSL